VSAGNGRPEITLEEEVAALQEELAEARAMIAGQRRVIRLMRELVAKNPERPRRRRKASEEPGPQANTNGPRAKVAPAKEQNR
jgi:hypothetical protein